MTLAFHQMGRPEIAAELAAILAQSFTPQDDPIIICWEMREPVIGGSQDNLEATALAVLALETVEGLTAQVEGGARFLMDRLPQPGVFSDRAAAATAMALGRYHAQTQPAAARLEIDVLLDGRVIDTVQWLGAPEAVSIALGEGEFDPAAVRLDFRPRGEGSFAYRAVISAFEPGVVASDQGGQGVWLNREYIQPERRHGGRTVPRGASVVVDARNVPSNPATAVERGGEVIVNVHFWRHADVMANAHLVVEEPLPAGTQLVDGSLSGNFVHSETLPGLLRLHWPLDSGWSGSFSYRLRGVVPGQFRVLPTAVRNVYNPDQTVRAQPAALATLRDGQPNPDPYTLTPDELYHLGLWQAEAGDHAAALGHLTELFDRWRLNQTADRAVTSQLLASALETGDAATAIRFFEVIRERHADIVLTWDQTLQVAQAYAAREEHEQAWQVLRGAAEASFLRDAQVAGVLEAQGAHRASIAHMDSLIATYPDLETVQSALFALAGAIELKANDAALRETLAEDGLTEAELHEMSLRRLEQFLADHPENPRAPDATLSLATLWVQLERRAPAIELCQALRRRYPESPLVDDALYLEAYARFQEGQDDEAAALCEQIAAGDFPTPEGPRAPSENTPQAQYILAQIRHAQGDAAGAVAAYRVIEQRFPDAAEAIAHFTRRALSLPEVTTHATEGAPAVTLTTCNLDEVHLRVFRVDLLTLVLLRRNLDQIVDVDLAGIRPTFDQAVNIGGADDFRAHETDVDLGLEEPGAYLVVAAADNEMASGLVLLSDLDLEVQEDPASGRVRVNLLGGDGQPLADADVRVIGTGNATFESGRTDRRGIFIADQISGAATVLVRSGEQFAFHRGETALGGAAWPQTPSPVAVEADADVLLGRALGNNMGTLRSQQSMLHDITVNTQRGVDVYRVRQ
ncbi:MAG: tetratricopeptide repeat protein [Candidatus Sumerlaeia bacterium]|nr:tetratricopeptide repeat protein [Candidatus Sumerlaeia bacterium]